MKNSKKAEEYVEQYRLRQLEKSFSTMAEKYMTTAYSRPPLDLNELERFLAAHVAVKPENSKLQERKNRIPDAVRQEIARQAGQTSQPAGELPHE